MLYAGVLTLFAVAIFDASLERRDQNHVTWKQSRSARMLVCCTQAETSDAHRKNNQLASRNTRASKACKPVYGPHRPFAYDLARVTGYQYYS